MTADRSSVMQARAWRLGFLLTGSSERATRVCQLLAAAQPAFASLEPPMLDRAVIQAARQIGLPASPSSSPTLEALRQLPAQSREAFVLSRVDAVDDLWLARAMDCSKTAARTHLDAASRLLIAAGHEPDALAAQLRKAADAIDPAPILAHARAQHRSAKRRRLLIALGVGFVVISILIIVLAQRAAP